MYGKEVYGIFVVHQTTGIWQYGLNRKQYLVKLNYVGWNKNPYQMKKIADRAVAIVGPNVNVSESRTESTKNSGITTEQ